MRISWANQEKASCSERGQMATRILLVDDHDMVRHRLRQMIQDQTQWEVCGEATDGQDAVRKHSILKPDVIVMDFNMPHLNGLDASRVILKNQPSACILMLSVSESRQLREEVRKAGIKGFCSKGFMDAFFEAVEVILRGETYFTEQPS
jgi:DNA-binding NarL/FixJ family response regulator